MQKDLRDTRAGRLLVQPQLGTCILGDSRFSLACARPHMSTQVQLGIDAGVANIVQRGGDFTNLESVNKELTSLHSPPPAQKSPHLVGRCTAMPEYKTMFLHVLFLSPKPVFISGLFNSSWNSTYVCLFFLKFCLPWLSPAQNCALRHLLFLRSIKPWLLQVLPRPQQGAAVSASCREHF